MATLAQVARVAREIDCNGGTACAPKRGGVEETWAASARQTHGPRSQTVRGTLGPTDTSPPQALRPCQALCDMAGLPLGAADEPATKHGGAPTYANAPQADEPHRFRAIGGAQAHSISLACSDLLTQRQPLLLAFAHDIALAFR